jgi:hypothetical protein
MLVFCCKAVNAIRLPHAENEADRAAIRDGIVKNMKRLSAPLLYFPEVRLFCQGIRSEMSRSCFDCSRAGTLQGKAFCGSISTCFPWASLLFQPPFALPHCYRWCSLVRCAGFPDESSVRAQQVGTVLVVCSGMLGSSVFRELLWLLFVPITVFDITFLPVVQAAEPGSDSAALEAASRVRMCRPL